MTFLTFILILCVLGFIIKFPTFVLFTVVVFSIVILCIIIILLQNPQYVIFIKEAKTFISMFVAKCDSCQEYYCSRNTGGGNYCDCTNLCSKCVKICSLCIGTYCKSHYKDCKQCGDHLCFGSCQECGCCLSCCTRCEYGCVNSKVKSKFCIECKELFIQCTSHDLNSNAPFCPNCAIWCNGCKDFLARVDYDFTTKTKCIRSCDIVDSCPKCKFDFVEAISTTIPVRSIVEFHIRPFLDVAHIRD